MIKPNAKGRISITVGGTVVIEVEDEISGLIAGVVLVEPGGFLSAVARNGSIPCEFWLNQSGAVGPTREVKRVGVRFDMHKLSQPRDTDPNGYRTPATVAALKPFEVDGWSADERDMWNLHNRIRKDKKAYQLVTFVRFVRDGKPVKLGR